MAKEVYQITVNLHKINWIIPIILATLLLEIKQQIVHLQIKQKIVLLQTKQQIVPPQTKHRIILQTKLQIKQQEIIQILQLIQANHLTHQQK